ncbi:hypothetical protein SBV1_2510006 [Verrucomicrobia bacterium]|nr:hypothetical protein SBV1_2510006 [Verrucomicrobiota bacterium]
MAADRRPPRHPAWFTRRPNFDSPGVGKFHLQFPVPVLSLELWYPARVKAVRDQTPVSGLCRSAPSTETGKHQGASQDACSGPASL